MATTKKLFWNQKNYSSNKTQVSQFVGLILCSKHRISNDIRVVWQVHSEYAWPPAAPYVPPKKRKSERGENWTRELIMGLTFSRPGKGMRPGLECNTVSILSKCNRSRRKDARNNLTTATSYFISNKMKINWKISAPAHCILFQFSMPSDPIFLNLRSSQTAARGGNGSWP